MLRLSLLLFLFACGDTDDKDDDDWWGGNDTATGSAADADGIADDPWGTDGGADEGSGTTDGGGGSASSAPGDECSDGGVFDCELECWVADAREYIGDGTCDTGQRGPNFDCLETGFDGADCATDDPDGGSGSTDADGAGDETGGEETGSESDAGTTDGGTTDGDTTDGGTTDGGTTDSGGTGAGGTTTGGDTLDGLGGCILDGVCSDGFAYGECTAFGGEWISDGCPEVFGECHDVVFYPEWSPYYIDPSADGFSADFELSCNTSNPTDVAYFWTPPSLREYCISASVHEITESENIAPVLSIWRVDCETELACDHGDFLADEPTASLRGTYSPDESYLVVLEHDLAGEVGYFSLTIEPCPL